MDMYKKIACGKKRKRFFEPIGKFNKLHSFLYSKKTLLMFFVLLLTLSIPRQAHSFDIESFIYPDMNKTISMDFRNAQLNDVLKIFSQQSGLNFIASTEIANSTVNLYLDRVPVEEALERILTANNLTYEIKSGSNIFVVKPLEKPSIELLTKVYPLKYASITSSKILSSLAGSNGGGGGEASSDDSEEGAAGIVSVIESLLTENGSVGEDLRTNSLIITDIPSNFPMIEQTLSKLDVRTPQILIEVEMLDIAKNVADLIGTKFGSTPVTFSGAQRDNTFPFNEDNLRDDGFEFADAQYRVSTISFQGLAFSMQFLRTHTDTKNLARPRILTLNNETAEIEISTNEAIGLETNTTTTEGTASTSLEAERVETGVFLSVTPQANILTGDITMSVEPRVIIAKSGSTFGGQTFKDPEERGTKSILRVKDGDTVIIGGLLRSDVTDTRTNVPVLSKVPILGEAFRHKDVTESQRELVIFITPHIVQENFAAQRQDRTYYPLDREQDLPTGLTNNSKQPTPFDN